MGHHRALANDGDIGRGPFSHHSFANQNRFVRQASDLFIRQGAGLNEGSFPSGDPSPGIVLVRLIEYFLENPDPEKLAVVLEVAKKSGLNSPANPRLQAAIVRATYITGPSPAMAGQGQPNAPQQKSPFNTPKFQNPSQKK